MVKVSNNAILFFIDWWLTTESFILYFLLLHLGLFFSRMASLEEDMELCKIMLDAVRVVCVWGSSFRGEEVARRQLGLDPFDH